MPKIMIVDDDPLARRLMRDSLRRADAGYDIIEVDKGVLALELIGHERPDLVLLDITMPGVGGIPVCNEMKRNPATKNVKIIIVSAHSDSDFIGAALDAGAIAYITKPFRPEELRHHVRRVLGASKETALA